jgi:hypothetical protein
MLVVSIRLRFVDLAEVGLPASPARPAAADVLTRPAPAGVPPARDRGPPNRRLGLGDCGHVYGSGDYPAED